MNARTKESKQQQQQQTVGSSLVNGEKVRSQILVPNEFSNLLISGHDFWFCHSKVAFCPHAEALGECLLLDIIEFKVNKTIENR